MLFATTLKAQDTPMSFGIKAGTSMSWLQGLGEKKFTGKAGDSSYRFFGAGGLTFGYAFNDMVGIGVEALYAGLGGVAIEKVTAPAKAEQYRIYTHNMVVPVMLKLFPMGCDPEEGILDIHVGGEAVLALEATAQATNGGDKFTQDANFKQEEVINMFTANVIGGIGYELPELGLTFEGRFSYGLMDVIKSNKKGEKFKTDNCLEKDSTLKNTYATLSVGYNFARLLED